MVPHIKNFNNIENILSHDNEYRINRKVFFQMKKGPTRLNEYRINPVLSSPQIGDILVGNCPEAGLTNIILL